MNSHIASTTNNNSTSQPVSIESIREILNRLPPPPKALKIFENLCFTVTRKPPTRKRRRLWRHWRKTNIIPNPDVYIVVNEFIAGHPATIKQLIEKLNDQSPAAGIDTN